MVNGANKSRSRIRSQVRLPGGTTVVRLNERKPSRLTCPTGRQLPGTHAGNPAEIAKYSKTERRPSRPYGGVLSSPAMRAVMLERVDAAYQVPQDSPGSYAVGNVCMKIAGRDAGKLCVITETLDANYVKVNGFTRSRKVNKTHLQPVGKSVDIKKNASSDEVRAALK